MKTINAKEEKKREQARKIRDLDIYDFYNTMVKENIYRIFIVYDNGEFTLSHPKILEDVQAFLELSQDFSKHEGIFIGREEGLETLFFAFVHDTRRGLAQGGLRFTSYPSLAEILVDGLRLSQGMTRKNALAGLSWGGGKGIMVFPPGITSTDQLKKGSPERRKYFEGYGRFIASLGGIYYTAEDVGTNTDDMQAILSQNRFTTCIPASAGGSGNPSPYTAKGVLRGMQAAWKVITGSEDMQDVKVAVQGAGNVGYPLIKYLYELGAKVYFCDMSEERIAELKAEMPGLIQVGLEEIYDVEADIFAPCARGASVNAQTIPRLKVKLVCGAANNILREPEADAQRLREKGIGFVPDFVCNRMGIINCADEWYGYLEEDSLIAADRVFPDTLRVFKYAKNRMTTTTQAAIDLADIAASELHPTIGHRGKRLIDHLLQTGWHNYPHSGHRKKTSLAFVPALDEGSIRLLWESKDYSKGEFSIAASPVSAASAPDLSSFLSPLLLDVHARAEEQFGDKKVKRILGSNHGGLSLQIAIEQATPYERHEIGRSRFMEMCHDLHANNDENIRKQLHLLGVGFDHNNWLDPMDETGRYVVDSLYKFMKKAGLISLQDWILNFCTNCQTVLVSSDVKRTPLKVEEKYYLKFKTWNNETIETCTFFPEYVLDAVAIAVKPDGKFASAIGKTVINPARGNKLPVIAVENLNTDAVFISPLFSFDDEKIARENEVLVLSQLFDDKGKICVEGFSELSPEEAYPLILEKFGDNKNIEKGEWEINPQRCKRCESIVLPKLSKQLFVNFDEAKILLRRALDQKEITFSEPQWEKYFRNTLDKINVWCISRQYWWGNYVPDGLENEKSWVFSTWFSLVAMSLQGIGWPDNPKPYPVDEVYADPDYLMRWILPAQLIGLLVTGRPVFKNINVHGSLHVIERVLKPNENFSPDLPDEERYSYSLVKRPMQKRLGNVVEPVSLMQRFGADALRLGYLLNLKNGFQKEVTASQAGFKLARKSLFRLVTKLTNIMSLLKKARDFSEESGDADEKILTQAEDIYQKVKQSYEQKRFYESAGLLVKMSDNFTDYCNQISRTYTEKGHTGNAIETIPLVITKMKLAFSPLCPYIFEKLEKWIIKQKELI